MTDGQPAQLGLRLVPRHPLRHPQPRGTARGRRHGAPQAEGRHRMRHTLLHCVHSGERREGRLENLTNAILHLFVLRVDDRVQHPLGPAIPVPKPGPLRRPPARPGRIPRRGPLSVPRSTVPRREQTQGVPAAHGQVRATLK